MSASNRELIKHILDEIDFILEQTSFKSKESAITDPVLSRALIRSLEIIGEASSKLDDDFRALYPQIEWRKIINTRNKLIHDYFGVDYDIVWDIIINKLPNLKHSLTDSIH